MELKAILLTSSFLYYKLSFCFPFLFIYRPDYPYKIQKKKIFTAAFLFWPLSLFISFMIITENNLSDGREFKNYRSWVSNH